jgi:hypothetical protein
LGGCIDFRACTQLGEEEVDFLFESVVVEIRAEEVVEVSDAEGREGCDCVAIRGAKNGCVWGLGV